MINNKRISQPLCFIGLVMLSVCMISASIMAQNRITHKFYFADKAPVMTDDEEVTTKIVVGDMDSEGRYTILSDLWKVGFSVSTHYHAEHTETFFLLSGHLFEGGPHRAVVFRSGPPPLCHFSCCGLSDEHYLPPEFSFPSAQAGSDG